MHQDHAIPWALLAKHVEASAQAVKRGRPRSRDDWARQKRDLCHFKRVFIRRIRDFAAIERRKYPPERDAQILTPNARVVSLDTLDKYERWLSTTGIEQVRAATTVGRWLDSVAQGSNAGVLMDLVKTMLAEDQDLSLLLAMARDPRFQVRTLASHGQSHQWGWLAVAEVALAAYITLNVIAELPSLYTDQAYYRSKAWRRTCNDILIRRDYDAQLGAHEDFFQPGIWRAEPDPSGHGRVGWFQLDIFADMARLKEYLRQLWQLIYRVEVLLQECGESKESWDYMITNVFYRFDFFWGHYGELLDDDSSADDERD